MQIFVEHWGDNLQFFPNFALFSTLGEMNLDHGFFQVCKVSEDQKKRSSPKLEDFFPRTQLENCAQMQIIRGDAYEDHTQIIRVDTVKLFPPKFRHPCQ